MRFKDMGLCVQNMIIIPVSIMNMIGETYMIIEWAQNLYSDNELGVHKSSKNYE